MKTSTSATTTENNFFGFETEDDYYQYLEDCSYAEYCDELISEEEDKYEHIYEQINK